MPSLTDLSDPSLIPATRPNEWLISGGEIHVWRAALDSSVLAQAQMMDLLSADERTRAGRYCFEWDRRRFVVRRTVLRVLLGGYLQVEPWELRFVYDRYGKPALANGGEAAQFDFSLSHSKGLALFAITRGKPIGIDVERFRPIKGYRQIAAHFFSGRESARLSASSPPQKLRAFLRLWTGKEAYLKACGKGLSKPLDEVEFSVEPTEPMQLLRVADDPTAVAEWSIIELNLGPDFIGAVAVRGRNLRLIDRSFSLPCFIR